MSDQPAQPERRLIWLRRARQGLVYFVQTTLYLVALTVLEFQLKGNSLVGVFLLLCSIVCLAGCTLAYLGVLFACFLRYSLWSLLAIVFAIGTSLTLIKQHDLFWKTLGLLGLTSCLPIVVASLYASDPDHGKGS